MGSVRDVTTRFPLAVNRRLARHCQYMGSSGRPKPCLSSCSSLIPVRKKKRICTTDKHEHMICHTGCARHFRLPRRGGRNTSGSLMFTVCSWWVCDDSRFSIARNRVRDTLWKCPSSMYCRQVAQRDKREKATPAPRRFDRPSPHNDGSLRHVQMQCAGCSGVETFNIPKQASEYTRKLCITETCVALKAA